MATTPIWTGTSSFAPGQTPFGFYDSDTQFQTDANKVAKFCAIRMGYPLVDIELQSGSFFAAFEEAVTTYGNELYLYQIRNNLFHGSKSDHVERDLLVVTVALPILKKMVVFCQSNFNKIEF